MELASYSMEGGAWEQARVKLHVAKILLVRNEIYSPDVPVYTCKYHKLCKIGSVK